MTACFPQTRSSQSEQLARQERDDRGLTEELVANVGIARPVAEKSVGIILGFPA
jgi:hypothetical protein